MRAQVLIICLIAFGMLSFMEGDDLNTEGTNFRENVNVFHVAKILDKPVMVFIGADYCIRSQRMNEVFMNKDLGCFLNEHFVCKKFNAKNPMQIIRANNWGITDVPSYAFFDRRGKMVYSFTGLRDAEQMMTEAQKALEIMKSQYVARQLQRSHIATAGN